MGGAARGAADGRVGGPGGSEPGAAFEAQVRAALVRLHDLPAMQRQPLASLATPPREAWDAGAGARRTLEAGRALQRALLEAVEALRPEVVAAGVAPGPVEVRGAGRRHRLLALRYVEALPAAETQRRLSLGRSEYFREHQRAVAAVAAMLRDRWGVAPTGAGVAGGAIGDREAPIAGAQGPGGGPREATPEVVAPALGSAGLPLALTSFVGRERELAEVAALLTGEPGALWARPRLVTLTGPGGVGKTRLALQVAARLAGDCGACFVPLAAVGDPGLVLSAIAHALGLREAGGRPLRDALEDRLKACETLLVLDNLEHLLGAAPVVSGLLAACPGLRVLVTSRAVLRVSGEHAYAVPPLALPGPGHLRGPTDTNPAPAVGPECADAVRLFVARAQAARAGFVLTAANARAVAAVCHRLDGLPLALELAAARTALLDPPALLARLERRLPLLTGGARDAPARQQTLRHTVAWSYDLLTAAEQALFRRLGVFAGGFTLEAAEAVCGDLGVPNQETATPPVAGTTAGRRTPSTPSTPSGSILDVLEALQGLVDNSLAQRDSRAAPVDLEERESRYVMLETIREFALECREGGGGRGEKPAGRAGGEDADVRARHAAYYLELAQVGEPELRGPAQLVWLARLEREHDNLRTALEWLEQGGRLEAALRLGGALWRFWMIRGHLSEGRARLSGLIERAAGVAGGAQRVDPAAHAEALLGAGVLAIFQADLDVAWSLQERALPLWQEAGDESGVAYTRFMLGNIAYSRGDLAAARSLLEESLAAQRAAGDRRGVAWAAGALGRTLVAAGEYDAARPLIEERLAICRELGDRLGVSLALWFMAELAFDRGDPEGAVAPRREALALCRELDDRNYVAPQLEGFAEAAAAGGDAARALRLAGAAASLREAEGTPPSAPEQVRLDRWLVLAMTAVGAQVRDAVWAEGQAMTREDAVACALAEGGASLPREPSPAADGPEAGAWPDAPGPSEGERVTQEVTPVRPAGRSAPAR